MGDSTPPVNHPLSSRGLFVPLDVNYADDPKVIEAGPEAELVYVRSLALAKRLASDGRIHRAHLWRLASDLPSVQSGEMAVTDFPEHLMASGLWDEDFDGWVIVAWDRWNLTAAEVEERKRGKARGAAVANHKRWHEARGVVDPDCSICSGRSSDGERIAIATGSESTKTETKEETETLLATAGRPRDPIFDALVEVCAINPAELTKSARGALNAARKQIADLGASDEDVRRKAHAYRVLYPSVSLTPSALVKHWPSLGMLSSPASSSEPVRPVLGRGLDAAPVWELDEHGNARAAG